MKHLDLNYIKSRRIQLALSHEEMAKNLGFADSSTYWKYENGNYKFKAEQLPILAKSLKCKITNFFS
jgi:transcriptional regulator with XRE-family HTH domain